MPKKMYCKQIVKSINFFVQGKYLCERRLEGDPDFLCGREVFVEGPSALLGLFISSKRLIIAALSSAAVLELESLSSKTK